MKWNVASDCVPGKKHTGKKCQDVANSFVSGDTTVIALCDGASSSSRAEIGASIVSDFSVQYFAKNFDALWDSDPNQDQRKIIKYHQELLRALSAAVNALGYLPIIVESRIQNKELYEYCTTLQLCAVKNNRMLFFKVGNGSAAVLINDQFSLVSESSSASPTAHITYATPSDLLDKCELSKYWLSDSVKAIILMTDGVDGNGLYQSGLTKRFTQEFTGILHSKAPQNKLHLLLENICNNAGNVSQDDAGVALLCTDNVPAELSETNENLLFPNALYQRIPADHSDSSKSGGTASGEEEQSTQNGNQSGSDVKRENPLLHLLRSLSSFMTTYVSKTLLLFMLLIIMCGFVLLSANRLSAIDREIRRLREDVAALNSNIVMTLKEDTPPAAGIPDETVAIKEVDPQPTVVDQQIVNATTSPALTDLVKESPTPVIAETPQI